VRVPDDAGHGKAKVTYSFDAWKEGAVAPSTIKIPVKGPSVEEKTDKK